MLYFIFILFILSQCVRVFMSLDLCNYLFIRFYICLLQSKNHCRVFFVCIWPVCVPKSLRSMFTLSVWSRARCCLRAQTFAHYRCGLFFGAAVFKSRLFIFFFFKSGVVSRAGACSRSWASTSRGWTWARTTTCSWRSCSRTRTTGASRAGNGSRAAKRTTTCKVRRKRNGAARELERRYIRSHSAARATHCNIMYIELWLLKCGCLWNWTVIVNWLCGA